MERFENTITAVFNGDSHNDEYVVFHHADEPTRAVAVAWNGGSLTTFSNHNYNYKIYSVDGENFVIIIEIINIKKIMNLILGSTRF